MTLTPYEQRDVVSTSIKITKAGDGLSKALAVAPVEYHHGDRVFVVLECVCVNVDYPVVKDTDVLNRRHTLETELATPVDEKLVRKVLDAQRAAIADARGEPELPLDDGG